MPTNKTTASEPRSVFPEQAIYVDDLGGSGLELDAEEIGLVETVLREGGEEHAPIVVGLDLNERGVVEAARRLSKRTITFRCSRVIARPIHWVTTPVLTLVEELATCPIPANEDDEAETEYCVRIAMGQSVRELLLGMGAGKDAERPTTVEARRASSLRLVSRSP